jgi:hypothetical protein
MSTALVAIKSARAFLRDINGITWTDSILFPFLQQAHGEMVQELELNSIGVVKKQSPVLLVQAGDFTLINQPSDIVEPISMMERYVGGNKDDFYDMYRVNFIPEDEPVQDLRYWAFNGEQIQFVGCIEDREVILRYDGTVNTPERLTDPLGFIFAERYIGPRIAALALDSIEKDSTRVQVLADSALYKLIQTNVLDYQRPVRHRPYRSPKFFRRFGNLFVNAGSSGVNGAGGSQPEGDFEDVTFFAPSNAPNGATTQFNFSKLPKFVIYNGLLLFSGFGYTVATIGADYVVTLKDINGATIIPQAGDIIREAA